MSHSLPLVYACAGCSHAGRAAYDVAQELSSRGDAEMSCLAGVAAELPVFLRVLDGREVWVIDGCPLECAKAVFDKLGRPIHRHIQLREHGVAKNAPRAGEGSAEEIASQICPSCHSDEECCSAGRK